MEFKIREEKPKIAIDVDGTLAKTMEALIEKFNKENNTNHTIDEIDNWDMGVIKVFGSLEKFLEMYNKLWEEGREKIQPYITREELKELLEYYDVVVISNRQDKRHEEFIQKWLKENFGFDLKIVLVGEILDKINNGNYELIIDDAPVLAEVAQNYKNRKLILVKRPWNKKVCEKIKSENVFFAETTEEAISIAIHLRKATEKIKEHPLKIK
jgi:5'(3')-deoxyribonucleotidase